MASTKNTSTKGKTLLLNTLLLVFCVVVIALFCFGPDAKVREFEEYLISFDSNGGSNVAELKITEGDKLKAPPAPTREGYIFVGWLLDGEPFDFSKEITDDVTLTAQWEVKKPDAVYYTIAFSTGGGSTIAPLTVEEGTTGSMPIAPTREGFTFVEWQFNGLTYDFTTPVTKDITLIAKWEVEEDEPTEPEEEGFKVKFNLNGGSGSIKTQTIEEGGKATKPSSNPKRSGYTFVGWTLSGKDYDFNSVVTKDITLVAQWNKLEANKFNVDIYNVNGFCSYVAVEEGKTFAIPSKCKIAQDGLNLVGWSTSKNATSANVTENKTTVSKNMTIYPVYKEKTYKVGCDYQTDATGNANTCKLYITEDGKKIQASGIFINNRPADVINIKGQWEKISEVTFNYKTLSGKTAKK